MATYCSSVSSVASSSSVLTESSHDLNVSEGEKKSTFLHLQLWIGLKAPKVSDFVYKRKVAVNLAPCSS